MDRIPLPGDDLTELPEIDRDNCNRFDIIASTDQYPNPRGGAPSTRIPALEGRPDIDLTIVEALRLAVVPNRGPRAVPEPREPDA